MISSYRACCLLVVLAIYGFPLHAIETYYPSIDAVIETDDLPHDMLENVEDDSNTPLEDRIRVKDFYYQEVSIPDTSSTDENATRDVGARLVTDLVLEEGFELAVPGLEQGFTFVVGEGEVSATVNMLGEAGIDDALLQDNGITTGDYPFVARIHSPAFPLKIRLNDDFFKPVQPNTYENYEEGSGPDGVEISLEVDMAIIVRYNWEGEGEILFDVGDGNTFPGFDVSQPFMLADSGVVTDISSILIDLSESASPNGQDNAWRGVQFREFTVAFTNGLDVPTTTVEVADGATSAQSDDFTGITFEDFAIGTGGFGGSMCGVGLNRNTTLFDMDVELEELCLEFTQNTLSGSAAKAKINNFPFFDGELRMGLALDLEGNFTIGLETTDDASGLVVLGVDQVMDFYVQSAFFEHRREENLFLVGLNGQTELLFMQDEDGNNARIDVNGFTVDSDGNVLLEGGWITLPNKVSTDFNSFDVALSQIGFGKTDPGSSTTNSQSWVGFTGGISLVDGLGAEAEMKRMQFLWPKQGSGDLPVDVKVEGVKVAYEQPNVLRFEGLVEWFETPSSSELASKGFAGKLQFDLLALNMTLNSRVVVGSAISPPPEEQAFKYFYLDLETQFPTGIPLGGSGIALYGMSGMFAYNMTPTISSFDSPVSWITAYIQADNVVAPSTGDATWMVQSDSLAFGGGVIMGTAPDNGFALNGKIALTIAVPGPVVLLSGQANLLKKRTSLSSGDVPLFIAAALYDGNEKNFIVNLGVFYELERILSASGEAEALFDLDTPSNWHLYLGQKDPEERRITAEALSLFKASAYHMIDPYALAMGAKAGFDNEWKYGPLKVVAEAWISFDGGVSWQPVHVWADAQMYAAVELSAYGVGVGLSAEAGLGVQAPKPYLIEGDFKVKLDLPWPLPDPKATVALKWQKDPDAKPEELSETVSSMTLHTKKDQWTLSPGLQSHTRSGGAEPDWPLATITDNDLSSPEQSIPVSGSATVESTDDGFAPLVPLDTFASIKFNKSMNDVNNIGTGNAYAYDNPQSETIDNKVFRYDAIEYVLYHDAKNGSTHDLSTPIAGDLYAVWPTIPLTASEQANNALDIVSKNNFRYYSNSTYLGYNSDADGWTEWVSDHYGYSLCLDAFDPDTAGGLWGLYTYRVPKPDKGANGTHYAQGFVPISRAPQLGNNVCPLELTYLEDEDFILPPYSVFRLIHEGSVSDGAGDVYRRYGNSIVFHTEGPPLALADYVRNTVPEFTDRPYYRDYHVGVQFNENYMNKLYRDDGNSLQLQILDENDIPIEGDIVTYWDEAVSHSLDESEVAWMELLESIGVASSSDLPGDDLVHGDAAEEGAVRQSQLHKVKVWMDDARLPGDSRLDSEEWLDLHDVGYFDRSAGRIVLYEFDYLSSKYKSFSELIGSYEDNGGKWFSLDVQEGIDTIVDSNHLLNIDYDSYINGSGTLSNSDVAKLGVFLRHLLSPTAPESYTDATLHEYIDRLPGYEGDIQDLADSDLDNFNKILTNWTDANSAYGAVEAKLGLDRTKEPLPEEIEISVLSQQTDSSYIGLLVELPEALDFSRIQLNYNDPLAGADDAIIIPNAENTRFFIFLVNGSGVRQLANGNHNLEFTYYRKLGEKLPKYFSDDGNDTEIAELSISIPDDKF